VFSLLGIGEPERRRLDAPAQTTTELKEEEIEK